MLVFFIMIAECCHYVFSWDNVGIIFSDGSVGIISCDRTEVVVCA